MKPIPNTFVLLAIVIASLTTAYAQDPLPSWNGGQAKQAIVEFVKTTTTQGTCSHPVTADTVARWPMTRRLWNNTIAMLGPIL